MRKLLDDIFSAFEQDRRHLNGEGTWFYTFASDPSTQVLSITGVRELPCTTWAKQLQCFKSTMPAIVAEAAKNNAQGNHRKTPRNTYHRVLFSLALTP